MAPSLHPRVGREVFLTVLWAGESIGTIFIFMRLAIRLKCFGKLYSDDFLVIFAWFCSFGGTILWQMINKNLYDQYKLSAGTLPLTPKVLKNEEDLLRGSAAYLFLWYFCIYGIKASFLLFFRRLDPLFDGRRKIWWWSVALVTLCAFVTSLATLQLKCLLSDFTFIFTKCGDEDVFAYQYAVFTYHCVIDVLSDSLIITIPVIMLWNVRIPWPKKLALITLFSLTVVVMVTAITRIAVTSLRYTQADVSWLYLWHNIEMSATLLVSSLASFRQLYVTQLQRAPTIGDSPSSSHSVPKQTYAG